MMRTRGKRLQENSSKSGFLHDDWSQVRICPGSAGMGDVGGHAKDLQASAAFP